MGEVIVYAEPEAKNEAAQFVTSLGGHPESRSLYSEIRSSLEKTKGLMIYLKGNEPLVKLLLQRKADPTLLNFWCKTALAIAFEHKVAAIVQLLLPTPVSPPAPFPKLH